ncbi:MAG TPA: hypothetical protein VMV41_00740 [Cellulomonadaceae bacterium]|nr:hypothetical protein [Cellulomonadaceae bacterium]
MATTTSGLWYPDGTTPMSIIQMIKSAQQSVETVAGMLAWTAYTPAWTATTTNPVLGNGALTGAYARTGKVVHYTILLSPGSTTTFGAGTYLFSLPILRKNAGWGAFGSVYAVVAGAVYTGGAGGQTPTTVAALIGSAFMSPTSPGTFTSGNRLSFAGTYEAA